MVVSDQNDMKSKLGKVTEERDKVQKKLEQANYLFSQHQQVNDISWYIIVLLTIIIMINLSHNISLTSMTTAFETHWNAVN